MAWGQSEGAATYCISLACPQTPKACRYFGRCRLFWDVEITCVVHAEWCKRGGVTGGGVKGKGWVQLNLCHVRQIASVGTVRVRPLHITEERHSTGNLHFCCCNANAVLVSCGGGRGGGVARIIELISFPTAVSTSPGQSVNSIPMKRFNVIDVVDK